MPSRPKRPRDPNQLAKRILDLATGEVTESVKINAAPARAAGGKIGGPARAKALSSDERKAIAQKAAKARWKK